MPFLHVEHKDCKLPDTSGKRADYRVQPGSLAKCGFAGCDRLWRLKNSNSYDNWEEVAFHRGELVTIEAEPEPEWRPNNDHYGDIRPRTYPPQHPGYTTRSRGSGWD